MNSKCEKTNFCTCFRIFAKMLHSIFLAATKPFFDEKNNFYEFFIKHSSRLIMG